MISSILELWLYLRSTYSASMNPPINPITNWTKVFLDTDNNNDDDDDDDDDDNDDDDNLI